MRMSSLRAVHRVGRRVRSPETARHAPRGRLVVYSEHLAAAAAFRPPVYPGPVLLVLATARLDHERVITDWTAVAGDRLTVQTVDADHYTIMNNPRVGILTAVINEWLDETSR